MNLHDCLTLYADQQLTVAFDFDDTICRSDGGSDLDLISLMEKVKQLGFRVVVYTARATGELAWVEDYLVRHGIRVAQVTNVKPIAIAFVDNLAVVWPEDVNMALARIKRLAGMQ